jgi:acetoin utilization protein AcuB
MLVEAYMSDSAVTISSDAAYTDAFAIMESKNLHHLPVVNEANEVLGILTRRDLQLAVQHFQDARVEVGEVMHTPVVTVSPDTTLSAAAKQMMDLRIGCLPVMDAHGHVIGMLTETDLFRALTELLDR